MRRNSGQPARTVGDLDVPSRLAVAVLLAAAAVALLPATAAARAFVSPDLAQRAKANPDAAFKVIVQGRSRERTRSIAARVLALQAENFANAKGVKRRFASINGVAAQLTGREITRLAGKRSILSITEDALVRVSDDYSNDQRWPYVSRTAKYWTEIGSGSSGSGTLRPPAIAIVDSGVDSSRADFGGRVLEQVTMTSLVPNSPGDGRGHGTFVASIAAGQASHYTGAVPNADIVSIDVTDDNGMAMTSDVIAAADWILRNKDRLGIRVANFSLHGSQRSTFRFEPMDRAVEKLWFSGVVVVTAAGNYADRERGVLYSPGNDPFVITVGALDIGGTTTAADDFVAPWSAHGSTLDGFAKPELGAPGRYMVGAVSADTTLARERPDRIVAPGYMQISGTSFAAPVVSGAAAYVLAEHPGWTPDQVKGALMLTARATPLVLDFAAGVGEVDAKAAAALSAPPNPNLSLDTFLVADPAGGALPVFDEATWTSAARLNASWDAATWTSATWTSATWTSATWSSATWTSATWTSATWTSSAGTSATWTSSSDATWTTSAETETNATNGEWISATELASARAELGLTPPPPPPPPPPPDRPPQAADGHGEHG